MNSRIKLYCVLAGLMLLAAPPGWAEEATYDLNIDAQSLSSALSVLAKQSKLQLVYFSEVVEGIQSPTISGKMTIQEAMGLLLADSALVYLTMDDDTLVIEAKPPTEPAEKTVINAPMPPSAKTSTLPLRNRIRDAEEVVVTGSNIRNHEMDATPVIQFDRDDILKSGYSNIAQLLASLPQNFEPQNLQGVGPGINLRGLGTDATLVLINGRRVASTLGAAVDPSMIPLNVIERVDILTDGASAIYGSNAVAGVVNFVLSEEFDGAQMLLRHAPDIGNDIDETVVGLTTGKDWSSGNALASYEYAESSNLGAADRAYSARPANWDLLPAIERHSFFGSAIQELNPAFELVGTGLYSDRDTVLRSGFVGGLPRLRRVQDRLYSVTLGVRGELMDRWGAELTGAFSKAERSEEFLIHDLTSFTLDGNIDGTFSHLPGGEAKFAVGAQLRREEVIFDTVPSQPTAGDRSVYAIHGETHIPLFGKSNRIPGVDRLDLNIAVRHEAYSGNVGSSTDPRIDALWSPLPGLNLRGSWGTAFHAPPLQSLNALDAGSFLTAVRDPQSTDPSGFSPILAISGGNADLKPESATTWTFGFDIVPRTIEALAIGVTYFDIEFKDRIANPLLLSDLLTNPDVASLFTFNPGQDLIDATIGLPRGFFNNTGIWTLQDVIAVFNGRQRNLWSTTIRGIDLDAKYSFSSRIGDWSLNLNGNYLFDLTSQASPSATPVSALGISGNPVDFRLRGGATWKNKRMSASLFLNHTAGHSDGFFDGFSGTRIVPGPAVDSWTTLDLRATYNARQHNQSWLNNIEVSLGAQNLLDEEPPFSSSFGNGFDGFNASPIGRLLSLQLTKSW